MKKLIVFILLISIITNQVINDYQTQVYYGFDWIKKDSDEFTLVFNSTPPTTTTVRLINGSTPCVPTCSTESNKLNCELISENCKADSDNPGTKFYYAVYYNLTANANIGENGENGISAGVTISVCKEYYLKYSFILLSLIILF